MKKHSTCDECECEKTVISSEDSPKVMEKKLLHLMSSLADSIGVDMFKKVATQAVNDHLHTKRQRKELPPAEAYAKLLEQVEELDEHLEELDGYVAEWMSNTPDGADMSELDDRLSHIEGFLAANCQGFEPLNDESTSDED